MIERTYLSDRASEKLLQKASIIHGGVWLLGMQNSLLADLHLGIRSLWFGDADRQGTHLLH